MTFYTAMKNVTARIFGSPERDRLTGAIAETTTDLAHQIGVDATSDWKLAAEEYLKQAKNHLDDWNLQQGWVSLMAAQRAILSNPKDPDRVRRVAITLRREAEKITGWRAKAIEDFLSCFKDDCGKADGDTDNKSPAPGAPERVKNQALSPEMCKRVIDAVALRDDHANTAYFKILLRRRSQIGRAHV